MSALKIFAISLKVTNFFELLNSHFLGEKKYKIRVSVNLSVRIKRLIKDEQISLFGIDLLFWAKID